MTIQISQVRIRVTELRYGTRDIGLYVICLF